MATPISTQDKVLVTVAMSLHGQRLMVTQRYRVGAAVPGTGQDVALLALLAQLQLTSGWVSKLKLVLPENLEIDALWAQVYDPIRYRKYIDLVGETGQYTEPATTANQAAVLTRFSEVANRAGISNMHIPVAGADSVMQAGELTPTFKTLMTNLGIANALTIITPTPAVTFVPVVNSTGLTVQGDVAGFSVGDTARVMRRRTVRVGE